MKKLVTGFMLLAFLLAGNSISDAKELNVSSPDGTIKVNIVLTDRIVWSVSSADEVLLKNCTLGMSLSDGTIIGGGIILN